MVGGQEYIRTISYGGVDFSGVPRENVAKRDFAHAVSAAGSPHPESQGRATADADRNEVWLGGGAGSAPGVKSRRGRASTSRPRSGGCRRPAGHYRLRADNLTATRLRGVRVCERMPAGLAFVRSSARARVRNGRHCWTVKRLAPDRAKTISVTARVLGNATWADPAHASASVPRGRPRAGRVAQLSVSVGARTPTRPVASRLSGGGSWRSPSHGDGAPPPGARVRRP